tara:strand:+ start:13 stop:927 length:915 start_codon:yes stop_codon:yes gene_type:complete
MKSILITGGTGLIGKSLIQSITGEGFIIYVLTRSMARSENNIHYINWDPNNGKLDLSIIPRINYVINLAGASIDGSRWTDSYKKKILDSRVNSTKLLFDHIKKLKKMPDVYVGASASGYYEKNTKIKQIEKDKMGKDFLSEVVEKWENQSLEFQKLGIRSVILRIGLVLSKDGGVLKKLYPIFKLFLGVPIGRGSQLISWIHIKDMIGIIESSIKDKKMQGIYNAVTPQVISNIQFTKELASVLSRPSYPQFIKAPPFIVRILFGEQSSLVLNGLNISSKKLIDSGFKFSFSRIDKALKHIYSK